ncbi:MAG: ROK family protein [Anaerolineae bacterium]|nr:ROK family protein [Anaerolineae bacterium]
MTDTVLAIDLGGTNFRVALMDRAGTVLRKDRQPTRIEEGPDATIARLIDSARGILARIQPGRDWGGRAGPARSFQGRHSDGPEYAGLDQCAAARQAG